MPYSDDQVQSERRLHKVTGDKALKVLHWLTWADSDYLAARKLLLDGLLVQGASLGPVRTTGVDGVASEKRARRGRIRRAVAGPQSRMITKYGPFFAATLRAGANFPDFFVDRR
jgi:hypothetical protein